MRAGGRRRIRASIFNFGEVEGAIGVLLW